MKTEEMGREALTAALAKKLKMREDGIEALELDTSKLRSDYDRVKHSHYWNGGYYGAIVVAVMGVNYGGNGAFLPAVAGVAAGLAAVSGIAKMHNKDNSGSVEYDLKSAVQIELVDIDGDTVTGVRDRYVSPLTEDVAMLTDVDAQSISACEIDEDRLTDMYNTASKAQKAERWAAAAALASLATATVALFGFDNTVANNIGIASMLSFFASAGGAGIQSLKKSRVENELQDVVTDRLIELKDQKPKSPQP